MMFARDTLSYEPKPLPDRMQRSDTEMIAAASAHLAVMRQRHSVRDFDPRPVPRGIIEDCIQTAGLAPSGANHQPWHFALIGNPQMKADIRTAAEAEERKFYSRDSADEWIRALEPIGTGPDKPHLVDAPWLIVIFAERYGQFDDGTRYKNYYVPESVGIASGFLISALHLAGLTCLTHTPNPMQFLTDICGRPKSNKPLMILAVGHPAADAHIPAVAKVKKPLDEILSRFD
jgi:nitroreductase